MKCLRLVATSLVMCFILSGFVFSEEAPVLIRVERQAAGDLVTLRSAGFPVVMEMDSCLFLRGSTKDLNGVHDQGFSARILDADPGPWDYLVIGLRPDSDRPAVEGWGKVLLAEANWVLVRVPHGTSLETLHPARVFITRLPETPADLPKNPPEEERVSSKSADPLVQKMVNSVSTTQIDQFWSDLTTNSPTGTRYTTSQGCRDAAAYCSSTMAAYDIPTQYQEWSTSNAPNVIGTHLGAIHPEEVYILIGHLDDLPSSGLAPGADDNASGSVNVLETARVLGCYAFRNTLKFIACTGEETGLDGSWAYADDAALRGENIQGVINMDMIGWGGNGSPSPENLDLNYNAASQDLGTRFAQAATTYNTGLVVDAFLCPSLSASDHYPFWQHGWKAVCGITDNEGYCGHSGNYPYYHTSNDTIAHCGDASFFYATVKTSVATLAELGQPFKITFDRGVYSCEASTIQIYLGDRDLNKNSVEVETATVNLSSTTEIIPERVTLGETNADSMIFRGNLPTTTAPPVHGDGLLSVSPGDTITGTYTDELDCDGSLDVPYSVSAGVDCTAPLITGIQAVDVTGNSAAIVWTTDEASTSAVHFGTEPPGESTTSSPALVTAHRVELTGLAECTMYFYWVASADGAGNIVSDNNGGTYYTFETGKNTHPDYSSTDTPRTIPDNNSTGASSIVTVADNNTVLDVNVKVNITHTYDGELGLYLITPAGTSITLANRRGGSGDNFRDTVFDDEASTSITAGSPPFTGSFRPESSLSAADGITAAGPWTLKVVDQGASDFGTIDNWTLVLTYPEMECGPHAQYSSHATVADLCRAGGTGNLDGLWDPGEEVQFSLTLRNDGSDPLTHLTATVTSTTPGVIILDGTALFPDLAPNSSGTSLDPHFQVRLPKTLTCGSSADFPITIGSDQGTWMDSLSHLIGQLVPSSGTALDENFSSGIPVTWTIVDGGSGGGTSSTWTTANPCSRSVASPMSTPTPIVDSDCAGSGVTQDEQLITPVLDLTTALTATLDFDDYFRYYSGGQSEIADVDVRSFLTSGSWINVSRQQGASGANPAHKTLDITAQAAGAADVQVRFHYYSATNEYYWQVDNVKVTNTEVTGCTMTVCDTPYNPPPPVPDGGFGIPMTAHHLSPGASSISLLWDVATCTAENYHLLYGPLTSVSTYTIGGGVCGLGTAGAYAWEAVPAGDLWFTVVAGDGISTEGTWGTSSSGAPQGGTAPSNQCGMTYRDNSGSCP